MKLLTKSLIALIGTMTLAMAPAMANAERVYFLVGVRHIYRIGLDRDANLQQRIEIEKDYADGVANDRDTFQKNVDDGADATKESDLLNDDLDRLADERDKKLGALFERADEMHDRHPELHIEGDGPYQVMGIDYHVEDRVEVFERFVVYAPWPGYVVVGRPYGGWVFGVEYGPTVFFGLYSGWHEHYYHGERFHDGFYGHHGPVAFAPHGFIDRRPVVMYGGKVGRPGNQVRTGGYGRPTDGRRTETRSGGYGRSTGISSSGRPTGNSGGSFGRSSGGTDNRTSGYGRTSGGVTRGSSSDSSYGNRTGGYSRSNDSSTNTSRSTGNGRSTGNNGASDGRGTSTRGTGSSTGSSAGTRGRTGSGSTSSTGSSRSSGSSSHSSGSKDDKKKGN